MSYLTTTAPPTVSAFLDLDLRQYQSNAIYQTYQHFESGLCSVLLYAPTGAGKTIIASKIIADYVRKGKRVMFMVHRGKLVRQTLDKLSRYFGIEASVIWSDYYTPDFSKPVQIAMLQTICYGHERNRELPPDIDLVILDKAHTGAYFQIWRQIMDKYSGGIIAVAKNTHTPVVKVATQLNLFTLAEDSETKAANDIYNPLRLQVGDVVASNNPNNQAYNWCGQIVKIHPSDPRLCYVSYPERQKLLNLKSNETWCRFVDLRRV